MSTQGLVGTGRRQLVDLNGKQVKINPKFANRNEHLTVKGVVFSDSAEQPAVGQRGWIYNEEDWILSWMEA